MSMSSCPCSSGKEDSLGDLVKSAIAGFRGKGRITAEEIASGWENAAGKRASKHSRPASFNRAVLKVNVDDSGWLYELTVKKKEILKRLGEELKSKKIKDIRFRIGELK